MVKNIYRTAILSTILISAVFIFGCSNDFFGFVASTDLDERLKSKNNFPFLNSYVDSNDPTKNIAINPEFPIEYKFLVVTDTHMEDGNDFSLRKIKEVISDHNTAAIAANTAKIEFAINLGDITQHGKERDIDLFIDIADDIKKESKIPFYPVIGNHDFYFGNWPEWRDKIGSTNYRIDIKNDTSPNNIHTTLLILDSGNAFLGTQQLDWLETEVNKAKGGKIFVFTHAAFFTTGIKMQQLTDTRERARVAYILKDKADIMFMGHSHQRVESKAGNVRYVTFEDFRSTGIYVIVHVKSSSVSYSFHKL